MYLLFFFFLGRDNYIFLSFIGNLPQPRFYSTVLAETECLCDLRTRSWLANFCKRILEQLGISSLMRIFNQALFFGNTLS